MEIALVTPEAVWDHGGAMSPFIKITHVPPGAYPATLQHEKRDGGRSRISIRDLAREAGVHHTTVSRALRNDPRLSCDQRLRIQALATARGYTPDPMLSSLMSYRRLKNRPRYQATLAWVTTGSDRNGWSIREEAKARYEGACQRAGELGYQVDKFWLGEEGMNEHRAAQVLGARNIRGLLFVDPPTVPAALGFDEGNFSLVSLDPILSGAKLNVVAPHHFRTMAAILQELQELGYRRHIGFACSPDAPIAARRLWQAAFAFAQEKSPGPIFSGTWNQEAFGAWVKSHRPEVILSDRPEVLEWLRAIGMTVPRDIGFVLTALPKGMNSCAGIRENSERIGATAVNLLIDMIQQSDCGISPSPMSCLIEGEWTAGETLIRRRKA